MGEKMAQIRPRLLHSSIRDHTILYIELLPPIKGNNPFRLFNSWLREWDFNDLYSNVWRTEIEGTPLFRVFRKIKIVREVARG